MKRLLTIFIILITVNLTAQELSITPYVSGPLGLPSKGDFEIYSKGATLQYDKYKLGWSDSRIFGRSFNTGYYFKKPKININYTYYYHNQHTGLRNWGSWVTVSKKITLWKRKKSGKN